jgi:hypothetical protein
MLWNGQLCTRLSKGKRKVAVMQEAYPFIAETRVQVIVGGQLFLCSDYPAYIGGSRIETF